MTEWKPSAVDAGQRARQRAFALVDELASSVRNRRYALYYLAAGLVLLSIVALPRARMLATMPGLLTLLLVVFGVPICTIILVAWWVSSRRHARVQAELLHVVGEDPSGGLRAAVLEGLGSSTGLSALRAALQAQVRVEAPVPAPEVGSPPLCPVCGQPVHLGPTCPACACAHHPECLEFVGGCASLACGRVPRGTVEQVRDLAVATNEWSGRAVMEAQATLLGVILGGPYLIGRLPFLVMPHAGAPSREGFYFGPVIPAILLVVVLVRLGLARRRQRSERRLVDLVGRPLVYSGDPRPVWPRFRVDALTFEHNRGGRLLGALTRGLVRLVPATLPAAVVLTSSQDPLLRALGTVAFILVDLTLVLAVTRSWAAGVHWLPLHIGVTRNRVAVSARACPSSDQASRS